MPIAPKRPSWSPASRSLSGGTHSRRVVRRQCRPTASKTLLWIDDYEPGLALYKAVFEGFGFQVITASAGRRGLHLAANCHVDAVVVDYEMPEMNGEQVAGLLKSNHPDLPIVMFTGSDTISHRARNLVDAVCDKAGSRNELLATIREILGDHQTSFLPTAIKTDRMAAVVAA